MVSGPLKLRLKAGSADALVAASKLVASTVAKANQEVRGCVRRLFAENRLRLGMLAGRGHPTPR